MWRFRRSCRFRRFERFRRFGRVRYCPAWYFDDRSNPKVAAIGERLLSGAVRGSRGAASSGGSEVEVEVVAVCPAGLRLVGRWGGAGLVWFLG